VVFAAVWSAGAGVQVALVLAAIASATAPAATIDVIHEAKAKGPFTQLLLGIVALMPQAGVALGMALVASSRSPQLKHVVLPVIINSTVFFELFGPILTRHALRRVKEVER
jgi:Kef-type K+ transport system membrane component KefB